MLFVFFYISTIIRSSFDWRPRVRTAYLRTASGACVVMRDGDVMFYDYLLFPRRRRREPHHGTAAEGPWGVGVLFWWGFWLYKGTTHYGRAYANTCRETQLNHRRYGNGCFFFCSGDTSRSTMSPRWFFWALKKKKLAKLVLCVHVVSMVVIIHSHRVVSSMVMVKS